MVARSRGWSRRNSLCAATLLLCGSALAQEPAVRGPGSFTVFDNLSVAPVEKTEVYRMTEGGILVADGAVGLVVTVAGELKGKADRDGVISVVLVPDFQPFDAAYRRRRVLLTCGEASANVAAGEASYFASRSQRIDSGFPRYRLLLYNTTGAAATVSVFVYQIR